MFRKLVLRVPGKAVVFLAAVLVTGVQAHADPNGWGKFGLESREIAGATVHYEKSLEGQLSVLDEAYTKFKADIAKGAELLARKDDIFKEINRILRISEPNAKMQEGVLEKTLRIFSLERSVLYLITQPTTKKYLRAGGELPNCSYNKPTDTVTYNPQFTWTSDEKHPGDFELAIPVPAGPTAADGIRGIFRAIGEWLGSGGMAIHEVSEMSLLLRVRPQGPYWRWFTDGAANAMTYELLKEFVDAETAEAYAKGFDAGKYKHLEIEINLRYWMSKNFAIEPPVDRDKELTYARYAYATYEVGRLVEKHGIDCLGLIVAEVCTGKDRSEQSLLRAIKVVTGEDMAKRLDRYQTFAARKEGIAKYGPAFNEAMSKKDSETALTNLLRVMELRDFQFEPTAMEDRRYAAMLLLNCGHLEAADKVMADCLELFKQSPIPYGPEAAMESFVKYALETKRVGKGLNAAKELLKKKPKHVLSLTVIMLMDVVDGRLEQAKERAREIQSVANKESRSYKVAQEILAIDPNNPPGKSGPQQ